MDTTRKAATATTTPARDPKKVRDARVPNGNSLRFTEYGELGTCRNSEGCDPYNSSQGKPVQDAWKRS
jgi:hypothetical protein